MKLRTLKRKGLTLRASALKPGSKVTWTIRVGGSLAAKAAGGVSRQGTATDHVLLSKRVLKKLQAGSVVGVSLAGTAKNGEHVVESGATTLT